ncbi:6583_t:CDS:2, partial [Gigaspora margarita]
MPPNANNTNMTKTELEGIEFFDEYDKENWNYGQFRKFLSKEKIHVEKPLVIIITTSIKIAPVIIAFTVNVIVVPTIGTNILLSPTPLVISSSWSNETYSDAPLFGGDDVKLSNGKTGRETIFPIYEQADSS